MKVPILIVALLFCTSNAQFDDSGKGNEVDARCTNEPELQECVFRFLPSVYFSQKERKCVEVPKGMCVQQALFDIMFKPKDFFSLQLCEETCKHSNSPGSTEPESVKTTETSESQPTPAQSPAENVTQPVTESSTTAPVEPTTTA